MSGAEGGACTMGSKLNKSEHIWRVCQSSEQWGCPCEQTETENIRARLHLASESKLQQLCDNTSNIALIENNRVVSDWVCNPFSSDSIVFNENSIASVITVLKR